MKTITSANPTLNEFIEQMRQLCIKNNHSVNISYNAKMALAKFYVKSDLVAERVLYRL
jgi:hypothetical protein